MNDLEVSHPLLVVGSSSGIGLGLSTLFLSNNRTVYGISRRTPEALINHANYQHYNCDIESNSERFLLLDKLSKDLKLFNSVCSPITIVFMAGTNQVKPFLCYSEKEIESLFSLNLMSNICMTQGFLEMLLPSPRLNFIYASSIWSSMSAPFRAPYGASKAAIESFVRHLSAEYIDHNIFFYNLALGFVDTPLTQKTISDPIISSKVSRLGNSTYVPIADIYRTINLLETTTSLKGTTINISNGYQFL